MSDKEFKKYCSDFSLKLEKYSICIDKLRKEGVEIEREKQRSEILNASAGTLHHMIKYQIWLSEKYEKQLID